MIVTYRHKPKPTRVRAQPATITNGIVTARQPNRYQRALVEPVGEPDASVREFFHRVGLGAAYDRINWTS